VVKIIFVDVHFRLQFVNYPHDRDKLWSKKILWIDN